MGIFRKGDVHYNLRTKELRKLPSISSQSFGLNSLFFRGSLLRNALNDELKLTSCFEKFKKDMHSWDSRKCTCYICT